MFGKKGKDNPFYNDHRFAGENHPFYGKFREESANFGTRWNQEQKDNFSNKLKGIPKTEEHKKKLSESLKGKLIGNKNPNHKYKVVV